LLIVRCVVTVRLLNGLFPLARRLFWPKLLLLFLLDARLLLLLLLRIFLQLLPLPLVAAGRALL